jgi:hypothetical protein
MFALPSLSHSIYVRVYMYIHIHTNVYIHTMYVVSHIPYMNPLNKGLVGHLPG